MCGINGIVQLRGEDHRIDRTELLQTRDYMARRGPDAVGEWLSPTGEVGLGHRRLAIIDLSSDGIQPMSWADGRYQIVFNGEIYNYQELRTQLEQAGVQFRSCSDTEVILALYAGEGVSMLKRLRGMFALAVWDNNTHRLLLARDPYGIKPLYYSTEGGYLRFASQVKALEAGQRISCEVDPAGVVGFLLWGSVPEPYTLRRAVRALPAGHYLETEDGVVGELQRYEYWQAEAKSETLAAGEALSDSVRQHLIADVPVGVFLSAGLDSALICALACRYLPEPPTTLTVRFRRFIDTPLDEGPVAAEVARRLGTRHIEQTVSRDVFPNLWQQVTAAMDQPSVDGFNVYVVSAVAHQAGFKVVLSGLGGDELFGSYPSFKEVPRWAKWAAVAARVPGLAASWPAIARRLRPQQPKLRGLLHFGATLPGAYYMRRGLFLPEEILQILDKDLALTGLAQCGPLGALQDSEWLGNKDGQAATAWEWVHHLESTRYMRNQLLRDADWASMAHSLELRVPLVDAKLHKQLATLQFEPARSQGKAALVQHLAPELPEQLWRRPKSGFFIPVREWLEENEPMPEVPRWGHDSRLVALKVLQTFLQTDTHLFTTA